MSKRWDYIIVGSGSAGCAAACELVRTGRTVLVLEAGGSDRALGLRIPAGVWRISAAHDWGYRSQPDPSRNGASEAWHRGRVLGGSSSINGMIYVRGACGDYDRWAQRCNQQGGWSAHEVMPLFRDLENSDQMGPARGRGGPLHITTVKHPHAVTRAFVESACTAGYPYNADYNDTRQEGVGYLQLTQRRGLRWSAADAFLKPIRHRTNLQLRLDALVEKIEVSKGRAVAVVFRHRGSRRREEARDIILSAGAINTPKLLMLSGIGDAEELERHRIHPLLHLPAVGTNLKEQPFVSLKFRSKISTYNLTEGVLQRLAIAAKYVCLHEGPIATAYEAAGFLKTVASAPSPDIQIFFAPIGWGQANGSMRLSSFPALSLCVVRSHVASSGRIRLVSRDPQAAPLIECRLLASQADTDTLVRGIEATRQIMRTKPIADLVGDEIAPGMAIASMRALQEHVQGHAGTTCQPIGTCRMGVDAEAVVGPDLRVRGTENLWIADASVVPDHISANMNAVCIMIGTKLAKQLATRP